jgi:hypothetical protein
MRYAARHDEKAAGAMAFPSTYCFMRYGCLTDHPLFAFGTS